MVVIICTTSSYSETVSAAKRFTLWAHCGYDRGDLATGTWGSGIFDDDVAMDVRGLFEEKLAEGASIESATQAVLQEFDDALEDMDDGPVIYLALAALQLEQGRVLESTRREAVRVIDEGRNLPRWEEAGPESLQERKRVLAGLKASLFSGR